MYISERFNPNALTRMRTSLSFGTGIGHCWTLRASGPPASCMTTAVMVLGVVVAIFLNGICE